jgi:heme-degrading monooxygenase HmoA
MMTVVTRVRLQPGQEEAWDAAFRRRIANVQEQPGWIAVQLGAPDGSAGERVVIGTWERREDWEAWHHSAGFQDTRDALEAAEAGGHSETWHDVVLDDHR